MAVVRGTNAGFVTTAPTADPNDVIWTVDNHTNATWDTAPVGAIKITEIGWWCDTASEEANFEIGIYSHNAETNKPDTLLWSAKTNAKGTTAGWKKVTGLDISITAGTVYWLAVQVDDVATATYGNRGAVTGRIADDTPSDTLDDPTWAGAYTYDNRLFAIYAVYEAAPPTNIKINISDVFKDVEAIKINIGDAWKDVTKVQINIGDVWKTVFG